MNISEHTDQFIQEMRRRNFSENTIRNYVSNIKMFFDWSKKDHPKNINESDIKNYLSRFTEPNTQGSHHSAIKKFYLICLNQPNKFKHIPYCRKDKKLPIVLSQDEIQQMFDVCENLKHKVILALTYSCGLRVSELINLQWQHIDRSRMIINIIRAKGNKDRQVALPAAIIPLLEKYYYHYHTKTYILDGQFTDQYSETSVNQVMKQLAAKAGIKKRVYSHLIRHCTFTHMVESGTDINLIQRIAGHANVKTTMGYCHLSDNLISKVQSPIASINL
jgi:site-specific recombinase XerD